MKKIDRTRLHRMLSTGRSQRECAERFGVSEAAISKAKRDTQAAVRKNVALESAPAVLDRSLKTMDQLLRINARANELLDAAMKTREHSTAVAAMREIRGQLSLQLDVFKTMYDIEMIALFQREVMTAIAEVSPALRDKIIMRLKELKAIRSSLVFKTGGKEHGQVSRADF